MHIEHISLKDFRNYGRLDLDVGPSVNIVYGNNAQGKTNLIEAINICSSVTGHRTSRDRDLIRFGSDGYEIRMTCFDEEYKSETELFAGFYVSDNGISSSGSVRRVLKHDGMKIDRISDYIGICNTVIFAPEDLNLIKGAPSGRRKFFNLMISKISPSYYDILSRTNRLINQKNASLKELKGDVYSINDAVFDFWDFSLSDLSAEMILMRYRFALLLAEKAKAHHGRISSGKEDLEITYNTVAGVNELLGRFFDEETKLHAFMDGSLSEANLSVLRHDLSEHLLAKFRQTRKTDVMKGISTTGIHRDDLEIKLGGLPMRLYSSQGQQRSAALSLKLSELDMIRDITGSSPVLLLDDVFSELDATRRKSLLESIRDAQIFVTCTDKDDAGMNISPDLMDTDKDIRFFHVESGSIISG